MTSKQQAEAISLALEAGAHCERAAGQHPRAHAFSLHGNSGRFLALPAASKARLVRQATRDVHRAPLFLALCATWLCLCAAAIAASMALIWPQLTPLAGLLGLSALIGLPWVLRAALIRRRVGALLSEECESAAMAAARGA